MKFCGFVKSLTSIDQQFPHIFLIHLFGDVTITEFAPTRWWIYSFELDVRALKLVSISIASARTESLTLTPDHRFSCGKNTAYAFFACTRESKPSADSWNYKKCVRQLLGTINAQKLALKPLYRSGTNHRRPSVYETRNRVYVSALFKKSVLSRLVNFVLRWRR